MLWTQADLDRVCNCTHRFGRHGGSDPYKCHSTGCSCPEFSTEVKASPPVIVNGGAFVHTTYICARCTEQIDKKGSCDVDSVPPGWSPMALGMHNAKAIFTPKADLTWTLLCGACRTGLDEFLARKAQSPKRRAFDIGEE